jgi:hypothetical protein
MSAHTPVRPVLAEQRRIVAKVDELMAVLAALEATLITSENLLAATIASLHRGEEPPQPALAAAEDRAQYRA